MRYQTQMQLPEIGAEGQKKIGSARILVVGAGGLGAPCLQYLAGAGIGMIGIIDHDVVQEKNLHRQTLYRMQDLGRNKALAAKDQLHALNPNICVQAHPQELARDNAESLLSGYDIIIDGTDNFTAKFSICDAALALGKPVIHGAVEGFEGQVAVFARPGPCLRCLYEKAPETQGCADTGVIGTAAGIIGIMQAQEALKIVLGLTALEKKLWLFDAKTLETKTLSIPQRAGCACTQTRETVLNFSPVCAATLPLEADICDLKGALIIDVREKKEWEAGHIPQALHLPLSLLQKNPESFARWRDHRPCVLYCQRGLRSQQAAEILLAAGFFGVLSLKGGYEAWQRQEAC